MSAEPLVYLDWNVFNKIEHEADLMRDEQRIYSAIKERATLKKISVPYSNAHINDLHRGYLKNPAYIQQHCETIREITANLCITQYWGETKVRWHYRDPRDFLQQVIEESDLIAPSYSQLFDDFDDPTAKALARLQMQMLSRVPMPPTFKQLYSLNPIWSVMFPRTKTAMNQLAFCEDFYEFTLKMKSDFALYKNFRKFLLELKSKAGAQQQVIRQIENPTKEPAKYLSWDGMWEEAASHFLPGKNAQYDRIINEYTTTDLKGYKQDDKFANLIDDALHTFYGAHCDYFVTLDERCYEKALKVFDKLKIPTSVCNPRELVEMLEESPT
jgi:hypothetical protein